MTSAEVRLRALDIDEHPDSGLTVGTLPLLGAEHWIARAAAPHADPVDANRRARTGTTSPGDRDIPPNPQGESL